ncbi:MAG: flagellar biosynthesis anti-sigma factor FlgM [Chloroflexi bacterium]|nr:flagellar biosynthesis anti-sigma factor FlgM [Chloroflexota bacterium]
MDRIEQSGVDPAQRDPVHRTPRPNPRVGGSHERHNQSAPADQIALSERARLLSRLGQAVDEAPDVREDKVRELQQAIEKGSYVLDSREIAEHMLGRKEQ